MASIFTIPRANVIRFVNTTNYSLNLSKPNFDNILLRDENWMKQGTTLIPYWQKFNYGDDILIQIISNYNTITLKLFDEDDVEVNITSMITTEVVYTYEDGSAVITNIKLDTTNIQSGNYYLKLLGTSNGLADIEFISEWLSVGDYSDLPYLEWSGSRFDGIYYTVLTKFGFRIDGTIGVYQNATEDVVYQGYDYSLISLRQIPQRLMKLMIDNVPRWICEKINIGLSHETILINDVSFTRKEAVKISWIELTSNYNIDVLLQERDYENYYSLVDQGGAPSVNVSWSMNGTDAMSVKDEEELIIY